MGHNDVYADAGCGIKKISRLDAEHFDLSLYGENGTAVVSTTEYTDASDGKEREYTLILSLPEQTLSFRADWCKP